MKISIDSIAAIDVYMCAGLSAVHVFLLVPFYRVISNQRGLTGGLRDVGFSFTVAVKRAADGEGPVLVRT